MKLTIKELSPYLPFALKGQVYVETGMQAPTHRWEDIDVGVITLSNMLCESRYLDFKPYLLPLSKLTEEIEHNGERFVPFQKMMDDFNGRTIIEELRITQTNEDFILYDLQEHDCGEMQIAMSYQFYQKLFEWHFDVFNLIDQGLAIDKSTINQEI